MDHVCRITRPYADLIRVFSNWTEVSDKVLVYEHPFGISLRTGKTQKEHCHVLIQGCTIGEEALKKRIKNIIRLSGNGDWSWSQAKYDGVEKYITYMTKGRYMPKYNKGYSEEFLENLCAKWVAPVSPAVPERSEGTGKAPDNKETIIGIWAEYVVHFEKWFKSKSHNLTMMEFQREARKFWYNQSDHHLFPPGSQQKRFLTSIFYHYKVLGAALKNGTYEENLEDFTVLTSLT